MIVEDLLPRLEKVRRNGDGRWSARCPAHKDRGPSLSIRDNQGTILLHCHAGCSVQSVASAIGVNLSELFPPRDPHEKAKYAREKFAKSTLKELRHEALVALITLADLCRKRTINDADAERAMVARQRILRLLSAIPNDTV